MPTATSKGDGAAANSQRFAEPQPDHLRNLVLNYLCHNCYLDTAQAFAKDSAVRHLDRDGNEVGDGAVGDAFNPQGSSTELSDELVRNIFLRQRIQLEILSGNVEKATDLLNQHFPKVLAEEDGDSDMEVTDENVNPSRLEYVGNTLDPIHLSLNLRILAFIEACRTVPLVYTPPGRAAESPTDDVSMAPPPKRDPKEDESHQAELLICVQKLYATVNSLQKSEDRAAYHKELSHVGGLLAYTVPENSPMAKYLRQERRDRVAEQINSAILHHTNMPSVSYLELAIRYTHCLWATLHDLRVRVPAGQRLSGVPLPSRPSESEKETCHEAPLFDLQYLLNSRT